MKKLMNDAELEFELQELYIIVNHWTTDVYFIQDEINFLLYVLDKYQEHGDKDSFNKKKAHFEQLLNGQKATIPGVIADVNRYLQLLVPLIYDSKNTINLNLLEEFSITGETILTLSSSVKSTKKELFMFIEQVMKSDKAA
ncbi:MAG: hypothetical protein ACXVAY_15815 [Mucilaginibacter sp.]